MRRFTPCSPLFLIFFFIFFIYHIVCIIFATMKGEIKCPCCGKVIGKYEDVRGDGDLYLFCKRCRKEKRIPIANISLDR